MENAIIAPVPFLQVDLGLEQIIQTIRDEISAAINHSRLKNDYNRDVSLSFGQIHINPYGSVSRISFDGCDVEDEDRFVVEQALHTRLYEYIDLRNDIRNHPQRFVVFPIQTGDDIYLTVLKYSSYFIEKYGDNLVSNHELFQVRYTPKYMVVRARIGAEWHTSCFLCGPYSIEEKFKRDMRAGRAFPHKDLFLAYVKARPEVYSSCGYCKQDLAITEKLVPFYQFYKSTVAKAGMRELKSIDEHGKIQIRLSKARYFKYLIEIQYTNVKEFCSMHGIEYRSLLSYLNGAKPQARYENGDVLPPTRLEELLNLPYKINEQTFLNTFIMQKIEYKDIPDAAEEY